MHTAGGRKCQEGSAGEEAAGNAWLVAACLPDWLAETAAQHQCTAPLPSTRIPRCTRRMAQLNKPFPFLRTHGNHGIHGRLDSVLVEAIACPGARKVDAALALQYQPSVAAAPRGASEARGALCNGRGSGGCQHRCQRNSQQQAPIHTCAAGRRRCALSDAKLKTGWDSVRRRYTLASAEHQGSTAIQLQFLSTVQEAMHVARLEPAQQPQGPAPRPTSGGAPAGG